MRTKRIRVLMALGMSILSVLSLAPPVPASDIHNFHVTMHRGRIDFVSILGTINIDYPGSDVPGCPGSFEIRTSFDYKTRSAQITGYNYKVPFVLPIFGGNYQAEAVGVERSGAATWNHDGDHAFGPITERVDFAIQNFNPTGCVKGTVVCDATIEMQFNGETRNARDALPDIYLRGVTTENISIRQPCSFPWSSLLANASVRIEQVPGSGDPDAWFRRI